MDGKPLLIFPKPRKTGRKKLDRRIPRGGPHFPSIERQRERLQPRFEQLNRVFESHRIELLNDPSGAEPEQVLVLETVGTIQEFITAVRNIPGMEWLGEWDEEDIPPDEDFFQDEKHKDKPLTGRLFMVMSNQRAMMELQSLWNRYQNNPSAALGHGRTKWRDFFQQLRNIRTWGVQDRLRETGLLEDWRERVEVGEERIRFEVELWFRSEEGERARTQEGFKHLLAAEGGQELGQAITPEIAYHGILAELPIKSVQTILDHKDTRLIRCGHVMFFRPVGQAVVALPQDEPLPGQGPSDRLTMPQGEPVVALLDGLPLEKHQWLSGRLIVDDPDGWSADYPAQDRCHGTSMASLIIHGELDIPDQPLARPVYVRPILKPDPRDWRTTRVERIPENILPIDLVHNALRRLFEGYGTEPPVAPTVRIINLSVGDPSRLFDHFLSPWARLLDWLAWRYNVLFIVSAGNHANEIVLDVPRASLGGPTPNKLESEIIKAIAQDARNRRLMAPAEAINVLTVGALHADSSVISYLGHRKDPYCSIGLPNPVNALGLGFRRAIKPEVLMPGGRQFYSEKLGATHTKATLCPDWSSIAPGQKVAAPGKTPGDLSYTRYSRGTSNAAALTTRIAARLYEIIRNLRLEPGGELLSGIKTWRRLTITLAWLTPTNPSHRAYRRAVLWFEPPMDLLQVNREEADANAVQRGTVQHEILEGNGATAFTDGEMLQIQVNCRADAGKLSDSVPYAIAVTLEVAEGVNVPIYEEIRTRIRPAIPISPVGSNDR